MDNTLTVIVKKEESKVKKITEKLACVYLTLLVVTFVKAAVKQYKAEKEKKVEELKGE